jgi:16S rRNA (guanine966-N2)-methyltransferase
MRITGGVFRSRVLKAPPGRGTRPTSDRVREALFGILEAAGELREARVLDLYAGTGALGLEAISRGAAHATFVESSRATLKVLRANIASLDVDERVRVVDADVGRAVQRALGGPFDLVLADPPWLSVDSGQACRALADLSAGSELSAHARVVLEHSTRTPPPEIAGLSKERSRSYGDATLTFYKPAILGSLPPGT